jgi:hypothetical protein
VLGLRICELKKSRSRVRASGRAVKIEGREELLAERRSISTSSLYGQRSVEFAFVMDRCKFVHVRVPLREVL